LGIVVNGKELESVTQFCYLGSIRSWPNYLRGTISR